MEGSHPMFRNKYLYRLSTFRIILLSFAGAILTGAFLLCLPFARRGAPVSFLDALFTATSAVCVTGLVVRDTYLGWSIFGRVVIISLIQIGGMGVVTIAILLRNSSDAACLQCNLRHPAGAGLCCFPFHLCVLQRRF